MEVPPQSGCRRFVDAALIANRCAGSRRQNGRRRVTKFFSAVELTIAASNGRAAGFKTTGE